MMRVVRSSVVSMWKRPPAVTLMALPPRDHSMILASPEKGQATVRTLPGSILMSSGRASILGAELIALNEEPSRWEAISVELLELAYASDVMDDIDIVSNFISAAILLKELDSIFDDIIACLAEEEVDDDFSILWTSFFIIMDELMADDDSFWVIVTDPLSASCCSR